MKKTVDEVLEHHGVKGQKWGVRKAATSGSSSGTASAKASSSESSRAAAGAAKAKQVLVDHAYAKRSAQIAGLSVLGIAAAGLAPGLLPAAVVAAAGGTTVLSAKVALAATVATRAAYVQNYISYAKRAKARVASVAHADGPSDPTVEQVYNALTPKQKLSAHLLIEDATQGVEFADDPDVQDGWASMTPTERSVVLFLASGTSLPGTAAHSNAVDEVLAHHGVKGQKWGVRKDLVGLSDLGPGGGMAIGKTRGSAELTKKEIKTVSSATQAVRNAIMDKTGMMSPDGPVAALNKAHKARYKDTQPTDAQIKEYDKKFTAIAEAHANAIAPRGTVARVHLDGNNMFLFVGKKEAVEAALNDFKHDDLTTRFVVTRDETGAIIEIRPSSLEHSDDPVDDILAHHGIKGQKWGVRRPVGSSGLVSRVVGKKASSEPVSTGLKPRTGSADQIAQDRIQKKIDTNGIHSLSNTELQSYTRRLQLEKDVNKALSEQSVATKVKTDGFIKKFIKNQGSRQIDRVVNKALDVAMEQAVLATGLKLHKSSKHFDPKEKLPSNLDAGKALVEVSKRMAPKKGK